MPLTLRAEVACTSPEVLMTEVTTSSAALAVRVTRPPLAMSEPVLRTTALPSAASVSTGCVTWNEISRSPCRSMAKARPPASTTCPSSAETTPLLRTASPANTA